MSYPDPDTNTKWSWPPEDRKSWKKGPKEYMEFYTHWLNRVDASSDFKEEFPYELSLGPCPIAPSGKPILITRAYDETYKRLLRLRGYDDWGQEKGVVITGQPGVGKTTFRMFALARLISAHQVVLLCNSVSMILFFGGKVYNRSMASAFEDDLPKHNAPYCPIWALIDFNKFEEPPITDRSDIWPVLTSSPNPVRWKEWRKQNGAAMWGMPLWTVEELEKGLRLQPEYSKFESQVRDRLSLEPTFSETPNKAEIDAAMDAFLKEMQEDKMVEAASAWDRNQAGDGNAMDVDRRPPVIPADFALNVLMKHAIKKFGHAPRDVFNGVFSLPDTESAHVAAMECVDYSKLITLSQTFSRDLQLDKFSHHMIAVQPHLGTLKRDRWTIDFKSPLIAEAVAESMRSLEYNHLRNAYHLLHNIPASSGMAGRFFEAIAHRVLSSKDAPQPVPMVSDSQVPPTFSTTDTLPSPAPPEDRAAKVVKIVDIIRGLGEVTSDSNRYYIPTSATNPLFDAFTIAFKPQEHAAKISIIQITTSPTHGGGADGYLRIRKIISHTRQLLNPPLRCEAQIEVNYVLVCPDDESHHHWSMPSGWNDNNGRNNQVGKAFSVRIPSHYLTIPSPA